MKKALAGLLSMLFMVTMLAACGGDKKPVSSKVPTTSAGEGTTTAAGEQTDPSGETTDPSGETADPSGETTDPSGDVSGTIGNNTTRPVTTARPVTTTSRPANTDPTKGVNLGGAEIIVSGGGDMFNKKKGTASNFDNAVADRTAKLEKALNCKITVKKVADPDKQQSAAFNAIMSGEKFADIVEATLHKVSAFMTSEMLVDMNTIKTLDLDRDYWKSAISDINNIKGKRFFALNAANVPVAASNVVLFNKRLAKELGFTGANDPYALVKSNKWTISQMAQMMKTGTIDNDGKPGMSDNDQWGLIQLDLGTCGMTSYMLASGAQMLLNNKGTITYNMKAAKTIDTLNKAYEFFVKNKTCSPVNGATDVLKMFKGGKVLFYSGPLGYIASMDDMDDDFGLLPFPRGDSEKSYSTYMDWNVGVFMIPKYAQTDKAGAVLEALAYLSADTTGIYKQEMGDRYLRDDESIEMLSIIESHQKADMIQMLGSGAVWPLHEGTYQVLYQTAGGKSPQTLVETYEKTATTALNELLAKIK